jgi:pimeloyl-ACP methyl ester carboxylesterase
MEVVVFVPGIFGSKLRNSGSEVWPPTPLEALTGYKRINDLLRDDLTPSGIIESVCIDFYGSVLRALRAFGYGDESTERRLVPYSYDWRRDILALAGDLDATLTRLVQGHPGVEMKLVCHSMGGLVARACLENANAAARPWAGAVKLAVFLTRLRLRPTSCIECLQHSGWQGSLIGAFHTTVKSSLGSPSRF